MSLLPSFIGNRGAQTESPREYLATEPENQGQGIVTLSDPLEEFSLGQVTDQAGNEAQGAIESFPVLSKQLPELGRAVEPLATRMPPMEGVLPGDPFSPTTPAPIDVETFSTRDPLLQVHVLTNPVDFESVPETFQETSDPFQAGNDSHEHDKYDTSFPNANQTPQYPPTEQDEHEADPKHYQPTPETNLGGEGSVSLGSFVFKTVGTDVPGTTIRPLVSTLEYEVLGEVKNYQTTPDTNLVLTDPLESGVEEDEEDHQGHSGFFSITQVNPTQEYDTSEVVTFQDMTTRSPEDLTDSTPVENNTELPSADPTKSDNASEPAGTDQTQATTGETHKDVSVYDEQDHIQTARPTQPSIMEATTLSAPTEGSGDEDTEVMVPKFSSPGDSEEAETEVEEHNTAASVESAELVTLTPEDYTDYHTSPHYVQVTTGK